LTNPDSNVIFREVQYFRQWWIWLISGITVAEVVVVMTVAILLPAMKEHPGHIGSSTIALFAAAVGTAALFMVLLLASHLITEVRSDGLYIKFWPFHLSYRKIPLEDAQKIESVTYDPLGDYGGWGLRGGRAKRAYNVMGNRGVKITYHDGHSTLIGSQEADELLGCIREIANST
jgi:hypothetical protein